MISGQTHYKKQKFYLHILQTEFDKRKQLYKNFSLRKFSFELGLEPSVVSKYFRNKRAITDSSFNQIIESLKLDKKLLEEKENKFSRSLSQLQLLPEEHKDILENWHAFVILESLHLSDAKPSIQWITDKTGIKYDIVNKVVKRLFEINAIVEDNGVWKDQFEKLTFITSENMDTSIGREFQKSVLKESVKSINQGQGSKKSHTNMIMAIDEKLVPEVLLKIRDFRRELATFIEENQHEKNNVYNLQINFHSLIK